eukprot:sb/3464532/
MQSEHWPDPFSCENCGQSIGLTGYIMISVGPRFIGVVGRKDFARYIGVSDKSRGPGKLRTGVRLEVVHREMLFYRIPIFDEQEVVPVELPQPTTQKEKLFQTLNFPKSSVLATILSCLDCALIFLSVTLLIMETEPKFKKHFEDPEDSYCLFLFVLNAAIMVSVPSYMQSEHWPDPFSCENCGQSIGLTGYISRTPIYWGGWGKGFCPVYRVVRSIELPGPIRTRYLGHVTGYQPFREQYCLIRSVPGNNWWAVITVTTVGYGDMVPISTLGKCMGSFAVFCGLIIIALPATIIVTRFSEEYERSKMQSDGGYNSAPLPSPPWLRLRDGTIEIPFPGLLSAISGPVLIILVRELWSEYWPDRLYHDISRTPIYRGGREKGFCPIYFTVDYGLRLFTHPSMKEFFTMILPWLDLLSILPFYIELLMMGFSSHRPSAFAEPGQSKCVMYLYRSRILVVV